MYAVPLYAITYKVAIVLPLVVVLAVQVRFKAALEPPGTPVVLGAVVVETLVIVAIIGAEGLVVMVAPVRGQ